MSEERFDRLENMVTQLIGMVGKVHAEQVDMKADIGELKSDVKDLKERMGGVEHRLDRIELNTMNTNDTLAYLVDKTHEHDRDIHMLKSRLLKV